MDLIDRKITVTKLIKRSGQVRHYYTIQSIGRYTYKYPWRKGYYLERLSPILYRVTHLDPSSTIQNFDLDDKIQNLIGSSDPVVERMGWILFIKKYKNEKRKTKKTSD